MSRRGTFTPKFCTMLWMALAVVAGILADPASARHPQDGPHVDLKVVVEETRVVVRVEMNLVFLDAMVELEREDPARISAEEWAEVPFVLEDHFLNQEVVRINGDRVVPELEALQINDPDLRLLPLFPVSGERGLRKIRFELVYPAEAPPIDRVEFVWLTYPPDILKDLPDPPPIAIAAEVVADGLRIPFVISADEPGYNWYRRDGDLEARLSPVPTPPTPRETVRPALAIGLLILGLACVPAWLIFDRSRRRIGWWIAIEAAVFGAAAMAFVLGVGTYAVHESVSPPTADQAEAVFRPLHQNIYRAFDYEEETKIYEALERAADAEFVDLLYRTIFRGLVMEEEGGAVARIARVRPLDIEVLEIGVEPAEDGSEWPAFRVRCRWQVDGVVSHWGHAHARTNEYDAIWSIAERPGGWRMTGAEVVSQDRVEIDSEEEFEL